MTEARKIVTVVFTDVFGSTSLGERLDAEALRRVMERYFAEARAAVELNGGIVEKFIGDAVMAVFGLPAAHEDDALRATRAACEIRQRLAGLNVELERERGVRLATRTGINTGEVVAGDVSSGEFYATGDAVNIAARLEEAAEPDEILLGEPTYRLVRDSVEVEAVEPMHLKGKAEAVAAYRLSDIIEGAPAVARRFDTPFVARESELAQVVACFERSVAERTPVLVTLLGPAGIGKTRLAAELVADVRESATVLEGRCLSYGESITFWPLREILRSLPALPAGVLNPEHAHGTEETFWAYRKILEALAREQPLVLVLEDIHWAEPTLLDFVEHAVEWTRDAPMLIVCLARPELLDERPGWTGERVELEPLPPAAAEMLVAALAFGLSTDMRTRAVEMAEGNPLFLEHLLVLAAEEPRELAIPETIRALLAARLDRLDAEERALLGRAAVVGKEFWRSALLHLSPPGTEVSGLLHRLVRRRLVRPDRSSFPGEDAFRFGHVLIRDAAYAAIAKEHRADLHEGFADWLEENASPYDEIVGYHLEQAYRHREALGPIDARGERLARRAAERFSRAGQTAHGRGDYSAAATLLMAAVELLPRGTHLRLSILPELGEALFWLGRYSEARSVLAEAVEEARRMKHRGLESYAFLAGSRVEAHAGPDGALITNQDLEQRGRGALAAFEQLGDVRGQAKARLLIGQALMWQFRNEAAVRVLEQALAHARVVGDDALADACAGLLPGALRDGPTPVGEAIDRVEQLLVTATSRVIFLERIFFGALASLYARRERFDDARECLRRARASAEEVGSEVDIATLAAFHAAAVERMAGNLDGAEAELRNGYEVLERLGEHGWRSTVAANLAGVLVAQDRIEEAQVFLRISEGTAASDDLASHVPLRLIRARICAARAEWDEAEALAREALALLEGTDDLEARADALISLGWVLGETGRTGEAFWAAEEALRLCEVKGTLVTGRDAQSLLEELAT